MLSASPEQQIALLHQGTILFAVGVRTFDVLSTHFRRIHHDSILFYELSYIGLIDMNKNTPFDVNVF